MQEPWCYVNETCGAVATKRIQSAGARGSFGRWFEVCSPARPPPSPPWPPSPPGLPFLSPPPPADFLRPGFEWAAPPGCRCSGYSNRHGYGGHCAAWEKALPGGEGQRPWCYVDEQCAQGVQNSRRRGSFGKVYAECVAAPATGKSADRAKDGLLTRFFGRRLAKGASPPSPSHRPPPSASSAVRPARDASRRGAASTRAHGARAHSSRYNLELDLAGESLLRRIERFQPRYVALLHDETQVTHKPASLSTASHPPLAHD